ncbi:hypothetical protein [Streptomyces sp. KR55]|uniref:hypothetical protein n=1 Tax=Streptomyces sp. KR55 TaxID=3457425 RepID=UPI003FCF359B
MLPDLPAHAVFGRRCVSFNIPVSPTRGQLTALAYELSRPRCTAARIAALLRTWKP